MVENTKERGETVAVTNRRAELKGELERWVTTLKDTYAPEKIILFGSFANGRVGEWSDVDLVIV